MILMWFLMNSAYFRRLDKYCYNWYMLSQTTSFLRIFWNEALGRRWGYDNRTLPAGVWFMLAQATIQNTVPNVYVHPSVKQYHALNGPFHCALWQDKVLGYSEWTKSYCTFQSSVSWCMIWVGPKLTFLICWWSYSSYFFLSLHLWFR